MYLGVCRCIDWLRMDHRVHAALSSVLLENFACSLFDDLALLAYTQIFQGFIGDSEPFIHRLGLEPSSIHLQIILQLAMIVCIHVWLISQLARFNLLSQGRDVMPPANRSKSFRG
jgi:hypothetical protein